MPASLSVVLLIKVGGATEVEVKERSYRVDDALHATRAVVEDRRAAASPCCGPSRCSMLKSNNEDQRLDRHRPQGVAGTAATSRTRVKTARHRR